MAASKVRGLCCNTGIGSISAFALLIALAGGLKPIITSLSDNKLDTLCRKLGAPDLLGYNYRANPDQVAEVHRLTGGKGVDIVVNNNGPADTPADLDSLVPYYGTISIVGFLAGTSANWDEGKLLTLIAKTARLSSNHCIY
ncbi:hypothetical protein QBC44DRAFT_384415 [Cladorrhinum sp. PSN332]|nr:hypothetical protein QBC44DRAFT_384415 [Cladorrhinum sp. PSN332]